MTHREYLLQVLGAIPKFQFFAGSKQIEIPYGDEYTLVFTFDDDGAPVNSILHINTKPETAEEVSSEPVEETTEG